MPGSPVEPPLPLFPEPGGLVSYVRVERPGEEPPADPGVLEAAVLDMHHGFANLGHASIVDTLLGIARDERALLGRRAPAFRVVSYDVRKGLALPRDPSRFALLVGTGGPGALDPRQNDGESPLSQGVREDPSWEAPLHRLFERVLADGRVSLLGICHSFGLLVRWSGIGHAEPRPASKGGKSAGVVVNYLTEKARRHPWFSGLYHASYGQRIQVLDSRLFDLLPTGRNGVDVLANEAAPGEGDARGEAITMVELARSADGQTPRVWGMNYHPEIGDRGQQRDRILRLHAAGLVSDAWLDERIRALDAWDSSESTERRLQITASFSFEQPVRRILQRAFAERMGRSLGL